VWTKEIILQFDKHKRFASFRYLFFFDVPIFFSPARCSAFLGHITIHADANAKRVKS